MGLNGLQCALGSLTRTLGVAERAGMAPLRPLCVTVSPSYDRIVTTLSIVTPQYSLSHSELASDWMAACILPPVIGS